MKRDKHGRKIPNDPTRHSGALDLPAKRFWDNINHEDMQIALSEAPDKYGAFLAAMSNPAYARVTMPTMMHKFNISLHEMQVLYADYQRHIGLMRMSSGVPQVMIDVVNDAQNKMVTCHACFGTGKVDSTRGKRTVKVKCAGCLGEGKVLEQGDKHARDLVFESMHLIKQPGGPLVNINQNFGGGVGLDSKFEDLMKLTQQIVADNHEPRPND